MNEHGSLPYLDTNSVVWSLDRRDSTSASPGAPQRRGSFCTYRRPARRSLVERPTIGSPAPRQGWPAGSLSPTLIPLSLFVRVFTPKEAPTRIVKFQRANAFLTRIGALVRCFYDNSRDPRQFVALQPSPTCKRRDWRGLKVPRCNAEWVPTIAERKIRS